MDSLKIPVVDGSTAVLTSLSQKVSTGGKLTEAETLMGLSATATKTFEAFGPSPRNAQPIDKPLPESLKGAIASARG